MQVRKKNTEKYMNNLKWIFFVCKRFSLVDKKGSSSVTTKLSVLGICFGVMTLIVVLSVMNGFQMQFIDSIIHISSYHVQVTNVKEDERSQIENFFLNNNNVVSFVQFKEAQSLMTNPSGKESVALIRALPENVLKIDSGFKNEVNMISGRFDLSGNGIVLGSRLAKSLGVRPGSQINLFALSGSSDTALISNERKFTVTGIFTCGYADINASCAFIGFSSGEKYFGRTGSVYGIKLKNQNSDRHFKTEFENCGFDCNVSVWRDYNRSFFGALRVEKNILMLFVIMIFIVVAINIYNSIRKLVFERRSEIAALSSLGGSRFSIRKIFVLRGLIIGLKGSLPGLFAGLVLSFNIKTVFLVILKIQYYFTYFFTMIFNSAMKDAVRENSMWYVYANIPARVNPGEVIFITLFGIFSCVIASWIASSNVLKMKILEVLHEE